MVAKKSTKTAPTLDELLRVLISMAGRIAVPPNRLRDIVSPRGSGKYVDAYNLCDGSRGISEVARDSGLDRSNLSKSINRWVESGVLFRIGDAPNLLHIYRLPSEYEQGDGSGDEDSVHADSESAAAPRQERARASAPRTPRGASVPGDGRRSSASRTVESSVVAPRLDSNDGPDGGLA